MREEEEIVEELFLLLSALTLFTQRPRGDELEGLTCLEGF